MMIPFKEISFLFHFWSLSWLLDSLLILVGLHSISQYTWLLWFEAVAIFVLLKIDCFCCKCCCGSLFFSLYCFWCVFETFNLDAFKGNNPGPKLLWTSEVCVIAYYLKKKTSFLLMNYFKQIKYTIDNGLKLNDGSAYNFSNLQWYKSIMNSVETIHQILNLTLFLDQWYAVRSSLMLGSGSESQLLVATQSQG